MHKNNDKKRCVICHATNARKCNLAKNYLVLEKRKKATLGAESPAKPTFTTELPTSNTMEVSCSTAIKEYNPFNLWQLWSTKIPALHSSRKRVKELFLQHAQVITLTLFYETAQIF